MHAARPTLNRGLLAALIAAGSTFASAAASEHAERDAAAARRRPAPSSQAAPNHLRRCRKASGLSSRQWRKMQKAKRRGTSS